MNTNGVEYVPISREKADEIRHRAVELVGLDADNIVAASAELARWRVMERREIYPYLREQLPEGVRPKREAKLKALAEKAIRKAGDKATQGYIAPVVDELTTEAEIDARLHRLRIDDAARERRAAERVGDLPSLVSQVLDWRALEAQPEPRWIVDEVIPERATVFVYGASGVGKSFACQSIAASIAGGFDWLGRPVVAGPVLYIFAEGGAGAGKRFAALADAWNRGKPIDGLQVLPVAPNLTSEIDVAELESLNREHDFAMIVYDTLNRVAGDAEENSATAMGGVLNAIERIRRAGSRTTSVVVTHSGKGGDLRGSSALWAAADVVLKLSGEPGYLKLEAEKQKDADGGVVGFYRLAPSSRHDTLTFQGVAPGHAEPSGAQAARIEEALAHFVRAYGQTGVTRAELAKNLAEWMDASPATAQRYIGDLISDHRLVAESGIRSTRLSLPHAPTTLPLD